MDGDNDQQSQAKEVRDLTQTIKQIGVNDPRRAKNETQMQSADGKTLKFTEP
jgi:hypothetical protein